MTALNFGLLGEDSWVRLDGGDVRALPEDVAGWVESRWHGEVPHAVLRLTPPGVVPDLDADALGFPVPVWHETGRSATNSSRLLMLVPDVSDARPRSLWDLAHELWQLRQRSERPNRALSRQQPELDELDWVVVALLGAAEKLHARGLSLGLLAPHNVVWLRRDDGSLLLVLSDYGLRCPDAVAPGLSKVVRETPGEGADLTPLWEREPAEMTRQDLDRAADLRTLARLFYWVLSGRAVRDLPAPEATSDPAARDEVHHVLRAAQSGEVATAGEFLAALMLPHSRKATRLGTFFTKGGGPEEPPDPNPKPRPRRRLRSALWLAAVSALFAAGVGGVGYLFYRAVYPPASAAEQDAVAAADRVLEAARAGRASLPDLGARPADEIEGALWDGRKSEAIDKVMGSLDGLFDAAGKLAELEARAPARARQAVAHRRKAMEAMAAEDVGKVGAALGVWSSTQADGNELPEAAACGRLDAFERAYARYLKLEDAKEDTQWADKVERRRHECGCR